MSDGTSHSWGDDDEHEFVDGDFQSDEIGWAFDPYQANDLRGSNTESDERAFNGIDGGGIARQPSGSSPSDDDHSPLWSSVTNPPGTVSVTVFPMVGSEPSSCPALPDMECR